MATYDDFRTHRRTSISSISGSLLAMLGRLIVWNDRRATLKILSRLSDYQLSDIGLERADIVRRTSRR
ncbi:hypothetical protein JSE7799_02520 [Jannaschia seosinensis]|uniref:YjiS-like domain-containing protein n=1 Tax=Jannaschia seosinensis TaxID=313367 RepID=A0A0M7BDB5_9RHOB|nr:DUF1127 domain-containing protein [Jannaschia seosinensis]CUH39792.1 hypothetical protein JSE7799_02520 [Jannaschia seosinensis]